jgi:MFS family permease
MSISEGTVAPHFGIAARPDAIALKALAASVIGYALDGFDLLILGFMLRAISADLRLSSAQAGSLVTWTLVGAVAGGIIFGILSDYYGRVRVLTWSILLFAVFTGLGAVAQGYWDLLFYRIIAGLGLGGEFGIGMALVAETWPAPLRARACSYVALGWQLGVLVAALVTPALLPIIGWRGMFLVGLIPGLVAFVVRLYVGEPKIFLNTMKAGRTKMTVALLVKDGATAKISLGMFVLCAVQNFGYYGLMIWMPSYLSGKFGFALTQSALWTAVTVLGMAFGISIFGVFADNVGRRPALLTFQAAAFVMVLVYSQLSAPMPLLIGGAVMGVFVNGMLGGYGTLLAELYPTQARATAENVLFNLGRGVGGFGPLVIGALAATYSFTTAIALLSTIYIVDIVATFALIPERKGRPLE